MITPRRFKQQISFRPRSIRPVETAIPAFMGITTITEDATGSLINRPVRIQNLADYEEKFGRSAPQPFSVRITQKYLQNGLGLYSTYFEIDGTHPAVPAQGQLMHYAMQHYFANGGGSCYVVSAASTLFLNALRVLADLRQPTLLLAPDAVNENSNDYKNIVEAMMEQCRRLRNRFTVIDVPQAVMGGSDSEPAINTNFRSKIVGDAELLRFGAAYYPYLHTSIPFETDDALIQITAHEIEYVDTMGNPVSPPASSPILEIPPHTPLAEVVESQPALYAGIRNFAAQFAVTLPPSAAIAGIYARVDAQRGVWKAPANVHVSFTHWPAIAVNNAFQRSLNTDPLGGKSINAIRSFTGRGTMVWGTRTLAGNDNEWRYVSVSRFFIFVEESIRRAMEEMVSFANDLTTWQLIRSMIEDFLMNLWRNGALRGDKPEHAYFVKIGLNETMTEVDIDNGDLRVEIGMAAVRPAEFVIFRIFQHQSQ